MDGDGYVHFPGKVQRQLDSSVRAVFETLEMSAQGFLFGPMLLTLLVNLAIKGSLNSVWHTFNTLQIISAFTMINFRPPANVQEVNKKFRKWVVDF